ncbi:DUF808 domain-containing protein [Deinococcus hopiensis]|uniref:Inner membrane protein YedI n=1 Tax=Deinococcus hopiensis KR-140 TaxID=695939 RepID=A0A1W1VGR9_9DEIO|nr:DUF808 domain-containing protein [Deinococcus hopiensis]SMB92433.1 hypothetical protein SAMN00790413_01563 [Deinococcus hopiensis KR-140]
MSGGLVALLDDVAAIAKLAAASVDDIGAAAGKAGIKAIGVVVDDTAVTPRYVAGFAPERELHIIWRIARGSLRNKLAFILPAALLLSQFLPWAITPLLMLGGTYLCYEGAEKLYEAVAGHHEGAEEDPAQRNSSAHEEQMVSGAVRTDFILSAEIMAIALAEVADQNFFARALILAVVAVMITALVYGVVGLIVKMDDFGLRLAERGSSAGRAFGRGLVRGMPAVMSLLSSVGTAAMLWVGGHILLDGLEKFGVTRPVRVLHEDAHRAGHAVPFGSGAVEWAVETMGSGMVGLLVGAAVVVGMHMLGRKH